MKAYALHLYLWLLTGRSDDFVSDGLRHVIRYRTLKPSADVVAARALLELGDTATDFHAIGAMAAAYASAPILRSLPPEQSVMFVAGVTALPVLTSTGATIVQPGANRWPNLRYHPKQIPAATEWTATHAGDHVALTNNKGSYERLALRSMDNVVYLDLRNDLSADSAVGFAYDGTWAEGESFSFSVPPSRYPYAAVVEKIIKSSSAIKLMSDHGTLEAFASSIDPLRKVGALATAIMLSIYRDAVAAGIPLGGLHVVGEEHLPPAAAGGLEGQLALDGHPLYFEDSALLYDIYYSLEGVLVLDEYPLDYEGGALHVDYD